MGAWGIKYFDNDDAGDFVGDLSDTPAWSTVTAALDAVVAVGDSYLEAPEASVAVAAAAVVANRKSGLSVSDFPDDLEAMAMLQSPSDEIVELALKALARVRTDPSELMELWNDAGEKAAWIATLTALEVSLSK